MPMYDGSVSPTITVSFDTGQIGLFTLGISPLDGTDVLGTYTPTWSAVTSTDISAISIRRGRTREDQLVQPGSLTVTLDNRSAKYDPDNTGSPYMWNGYSMLTRGMEVKVEATWAATPYTLYRGYLEQIEVDQSLDPVAVLTFTDALAWLGSQNVAAIASSFAADTTATRVGRILDAVGWDASLRSLTGSRTMLATTYGDTALNLAEQATSCEYGRFFADRTGQIVLMPYESTFTTTNRLTFSDDRSDGTIEYDTIKTSPGAKYLANTVILTQTSGTTQTYTNSLSVARYGTYNRNITAPIDDNTIAATLAQIVGDKWAYPQTRVESIEFDALGLGTIWPSLLQTDLGDNSTINRTTVDGRARTYRALIESINHDLTPYNWRVSMDLSPASSSIYFTLGTSLLGGTDGLYY